MCFHSSETPIGVSGHAGTILQGATSQRTDPLRCSQRSLWHHTALCYSSRVQRALTPLQKMCPCHTQLPLKDASLWNIPYDGIMHNKYSCRCRRPLGHHKPVPHVLCTGRLQPSTFESKRIERLFQVKISPQDFRKHYIHTSVYIFALTHHRLWF